MSRTNFLLSCALVLALIGLATVAAQAQEELTTQTVVFQEGVSPDASYEMNFSELNGGCGSCVYTTEFAFHDIGNSQGTSVQRITMRWDLSSLPYNATFVAARVTITEGSRRCSITSPSTTLSNAPAGAS